MKQRKSLFFFETVFIAFHLSGQRNCELFFKGSNELIFWNFLCF